MTTGYDNPAQLHLSDLDTAIGVARKAIAFDSVAQAHETQRLVESARAEFIAGPEGEKARNLRQRVIGMKSELEQQEAKRDAAQLAIDAALAADDEAKLQAAERKHDAAVAAIAATARRLPHVQQLADEAARALADGWAAKFSDLRNRLVKENRVELAALSKRVRERLEGDKELQRCLELACTIDALSATDCSNGPCVSHLYQLPKGTW